MIVTVGLHAHGKTRKKDHASQAYTCQIVCEISWDRSSLETSTLLNLKQLVNEKSLKSDKQTTSTSKMATQVSPAPEAEMFL